MVFVGCGNMGAALASGYVGRVRDARLVVVDPQPDKARAMLPDDGRVRLVSDLGDVGTMDPVATVLAVKPQSIGAVLVSLAHLAAASGLVVSIAAGVTAESIRAVLPGARIVRAMPNTPAMLGKGVTGLWGGPEVSDDDRQVCETLFGAVGKAIWVRSEADMDAVTAVSGSGPAYVFAVAEAMAAAGVGLGLDPDVAAMLTRETIRGAAAMLGQDGAVPASLKAAVRSPAGTTDAALRVFESADALNDLFGRALAAAGRRAAELSRGG